MIILIAVLKYSDDKRLFRLYDCNSMETRDVPEEEVIEGLKNNKLRIDNLGLNEDENLVGTQGSIERYATIGVSTEARHRYPVVVINKTNNGFNNGFTVVDCVGSKLVMGEDDLISYAQQYGIANAKVVTKGKTRFVSAISGTFELVGGKLSDTITAQWERLQALKQEGKLTKWSAEKLDALEWEFETKIQRLRKSELRNKMNGAFDIARTYNLINDIADILDEVDIDRVDEAQKKVSKLYKEVKALGKCKKNRTDKEAREKFNSAIKVIGKELKKTIRFVEEEEISSDECIRRFEVISKHLSKLRASYSPDK